MEYDIIEEVRMNPNLIKCGVKSCGETLKSPEEFTHHMKLHRKRHSLRYLPLSIVEKLVIPLEFKK